MRNIQIDSRLQLLEPGGDRPYFLKSNAQLLTLLKKKNRENRENGLWENNGNIIAGEEDWRRDLELAKQSIATSVPIVKEHPSLKNHFSRELKLAIEKGTGDKLGRDYSNHMIQRNMIGTVNNEFLWDGYEDQGEFLDEEFQDWDDKMLKLQRKLEVVKEPRKHDYDRINWNKEFVRVEHASKAESIQQKLFVGSVLKYTAQKNALRKDGFRSEEANHQDNPNKSQFLSQSMVNDHAFQMTQNEVMRRDGTRVQLKIEDKVGALNDWGLNLENIVTNRESQALWLDLVEMIQSNLKNRNLILQLDRLQANYDYLLVKYGGYESLVEILKKVHFARSQVSLNNFSLEENSGARMDPEEIKFRHYPLSDKNDNQRARELLALTEACHNSIVKERIEKMQASNWSLIERESQISNFHNDALTSRENNTIRLIKGFLDHTILLKEPARIPYEQDKNDIGIFGILYMLFICGNLNLMDRLMENYKGSLRGKIDRLKFIFKDWWICYNNCDNLDFFDEEMISNRKTTFESLADTVGGSAEGSSNDIFYVLLVETFLQTKIASSSQRELVVDTFMDMIILALNKSLSFGIRPENQGWSIKNSQKCLTSQLSEDKRVILQYSMEMVSSLMIAEILESLSESEEYLVEAEHFGLFLGETGILDVIDLFRDIFINSQYSSEDMTSPSTPPELNCSRDFIYKTSLKFSSEIAQNFPVECLLYLDLAKAINPKIIDSLLNEYSEMQENTEIQSVSRILQRGNFNEKNKLLPIVQDSHMIMLNKRLEQLKQNDVLTLVIKQYLFGAFFDVEPKSLGNLKLLRSSVSPHFLKLFFDNICSKAKDLKLTNLHHARLLEEHGRPKQILELFIWQENQIIGRILSLIFKYSEQIQKISNYSQKQKIRVNKDSREMSRILFENLRDVCGKDSFQNSQLSSQKTYLEKVIIMHSDSPLFQQEERFEEAMILINIRKAMEGYFLLKGLDSTLIFINNCNFYQFSLRFTNYSVSCYLLLIHFHLFLLKQYHNKMINQVTNWKMTFESITRQARIINNFYNSKISHVMVEFENANKFRLTQEKIDELINYFSIMN